MERPRLTTKWTNLRAAIKCWRPTGDQIPSLEELAKEKGISMDRNAGWTLRLGQIAALAGISRRTIQRALEGKRIELKKAEPLAEVLRKSLEDLGCEYDLQDDAEGSTRAQDPLRSELGALVDFRLSDFAGNPSRELRRLKRSVGRDLANGNLRSLRKSFAAQERVAAYFLIKRLIGKLLFRFEEVKPQLEKRYKLTRVELEKQLRGKSLGELKNLLECWESTLSTRNDAAATAKTKKNVALKEAEEAERSAIKTANAGAMNELQHLVAQSFEPVAAPAREAPHPVAARMSAANLANPA